ncbi:MAG: DNA-binding protein [Rhizobacter sp.]|nr:DNA-binding protein [Rhizobacter sp.]
MSRSERLLSLLQLLRRHRHPVGGSVVADELGISLRTLYRDISTLRSQGAGIDGAPGLGYVLKPGFVLPPLMFSADEVDALVLGSRWVLKRGDQRLAAAARNALAKITAVLPQELAREMESSALLIGPAQPLAVTDLEITIREAIRLEHKLELTYQDAGNENSRRTIWPFALGYFDSSRVMVGWCEMRQAIRHFRTDRVVSLSVPGCRYPRRRQALIKEWREQEGIPEP